MATQDITDIFIDVLERVKTLDPVNTRKWFDELTALGFDGGILEIGCPDEASCGFLRERCPVTC